MCTKILGLIFFSRVQLVSQFFYNIGLSFEVDYANVRDV
jgi:hypothetical protein